MKTAHRYILEPYKGMNTRYRCPCCQQKDKTFSLYIDTETGEHIHPSVGRCNRESNCGHHYTPKQYFQDNNISFDTPKAYMPRSVKPHPKSVSFIPVEVFKASLKAHETNHFVQFLINLFGVEVASQLVSRYFIATSKHWNGATVFWQIDTQGKVRTGKIMLYSPNTGKRVKNLALPVYWVHKALMQPEFELSQCFFGEHLLIDKTKPVAIVESEKTAIIASCYLPKFIWLAVGGINNLKVDRCRILMGREVVLFPDVNAYKDWSNRAKELKPLFNVQVSDLLEKKASKEDRVNGLDIADYLIKFNLQDFSNRIPLTTIKEYKNIEQSLRVNLKTTTSINKLESKQGETWKVVVDDLETFFSTSSICHSIRINQCTVISNLKQFIKSHISVLRNYDGNRYFLPFLDRLIFLKNIIQQNK